MKTIAPKFTVFRTLKVGDVFLLTAKNRPLGRFRKSSKHTAIRLREDGRGQTHQSVRFDSEEVVSR